MSSHRDGIERIGRHPLGGAVKEREAGCRLGPIGQAAPATEPRPGPRPAALAVSLGTRAAGGGLASTLVRGCPPGGELLHYGAEPLGGPGLGPVGGRLVARCHGGREAPGVCLALPRDPEPASDPDRAAREGGDVSGYL